MVLNVEPRTEFLQREAAQKGLETQRRLVNLERGMKHLNDLAFQDAQWMKVCVFKAESTARELYPCVKEDPKAGASLKSKVREVEQIGVDAVLRSLQRLEALQNLHQKLHTWLKQNLTEEPGAVSRMPECPRFSSRKQVKMWRVMFELAWFHILVKTPDGLTDGLILTPDGRTPYCLTLTPDGLRPYGLTLTSDCLILTPYGLTSKGLTLTPDGLTSDGLTLTLDGLTCDGLTSVGLTLTSYGLTSYGLTSNGLTPTPCGLISSKRALAGKEDNEFGQARKVDSIIEQLECCKALMTESWRFCEKMMKKTERYY